MSERQSVARRPVQMTAAETYDACMEDNNDAEMCMAQADMASPSSMTSSEPGTLLTDDQQQPGESWVDREGSNDITIALDTLLGNGVTIKEGGMTVIVPRDKWPLITGSVAASLGQQIEPSLAELHLLVGNRAVADDTISRGVDHVVQFLSLTDRSMMQAAVQRADGFVQNNLAAIRAAGSAAELHTAIRGVLNALRDGYKAVADYDASVSFTTGALLTVSEITLAICSTILTKGMGSYLIASGGFTAVGAKVAAAAIVGIPKLLLTHGLDAASGHGINQNKLILDVFGLGIDVGAPYLTEAVGQSIGGPINAQSAEAGSAAPVSEATTLENAEALNENARPLLDSSVKQTVKGKATAYGAGKAKEQVKGAIPNP